MKKLKYPRPFGTVSNPNLRTIEVVDQPHRQMLDWRGVEAPCPTCQGSGVKVYSNTATWMGGMGGASLTPGVCDKCWGSGDRERPWTNLKALRNSEDARVRKGVEEWLSTRLGINLNQQRELVRRIADVVEKESRRRKVEFWWARACENFANTLRDLAKEPSP